MTSPSRTNQHRYAPSVVAQLRSLMPSRPLSFGEAQRIAELQANRLLKLTLSTSAPVSEFIITELPRISVGWAGNLIGSGATAWSRGMWQVRLNAAEPPTRQRFTLAHELKHILDAACEDVTYGHLPAGPARERYIEAICDHFSASLLMPKSWVKKLWGGGVQDISDLAWRFEVSQQAMLIRLQALGLVEPIRRHAIVHRLGGVAVHPKAAQSRRSRPNTKLMRATAQRYARRRRHLAPALI